MPQARRNDDEPPAVAAKGWRYHHLGIPTDKPKPGERYLEPYKIYVSGFETSPYGIEWMRFELDSPISELIRTVPHVAFEVDNLDAEIKGKRLLGEVSEPSEGVRTAMIVDNGAPVELLEFRKARRRRGSILAHKLYFIVSGAIFFLVGIFHLFRLVYHWPFVVGTATVPFLLSYIGCPASLGYAAWAVWSLRTEHKYIRAKTEDRG